MYIVINHYLITVSSHTKFPFLLIFCVSKISCFYQAAIGIAKFFANKNISKYYLSCNNYYISCSTFIFINLFALHCPFMSHLLEFFDRHGVLLLLVLLLGKGRVRGGKHSEGAGAVQPLQDPSLLRQVQQHIEPPCRDM